jgi:hypothetical protein
MASFETFIAQNLYLGLPSVQFRDLALHDIKNFLNTLISFKDLGELL